jgi:hypothetical protein
VLQFLVKIVFSNELFNYFIYFVEVVDTRESLERLLNPLVFI